MWDKIKGMLYTFSYVTTGAVFAVALFLTSFEPDANMSVKLLWQILGTSFACIFGNLLYPVNKELSKKQLGIRRIIHYLYINVIVLGCGYCFKWFFIEDIKRLVSILFLIAVVFAVVSFVMWSGDKRISDQLNERLKEYQKKDSNI